MKDKVRHNREPPSFLLVLPLFFSLSLSTILVCNIDTRMNKRRASPSFPPSFRPSLPTPIIFVLKIEGQEAREGRGTGRRGAPLP